MSLVLYDGKRLIPSPFINISKQYTKSGDGKIIGKIYNITITGTIVAHMGSPATDGTFHTASNYPPDEVISPESRLSAIQRKQEAIRDLFSSEGLQLEIQSMDATAPVKCNPRVISIDFPEDTWYNTSRYTISLEADELYPKQEDDFNDEYLSNVDENWQIETDEDNPETIGLPRTYRITHSVSAVGKRFYDDTGTLTKEAWQQAQEHVLAKLGFDNSIMLSSGINNLPSYYSGFNHIRTEDKNIRGGSYSVTETWIVASGSALEEVTVNVVTNIEEPLTQVSVEGTVRGLEIRDTNMQIVSEKYDNALTKFQQASGLAFFRAEQYSNLNLNIEPISSTIGLNPILGVITYNFDYNDRPMNIVDEALIENISISDGLVGESIASIFVPGRATGPVLQNLNTRPVLTRNLNIELTMAIPSFGDFSESSIRNVFNNTNPRVKPSTSGSFDKILRAADPSNMGFERVFRDQPQEVWEPKTGVYSYTITWSYE